MKRPRHSRVAGGRAPAETPPWAAQRRQAASRPRAELPPVEAAEWVGQSAPAGTSRRGAPRRREAAVRVARATADHPLAARVERVSRVPWQEVAGRPLRAPATPALAEVPREHRTPRTPPSSLTPAGRAA